jgi:hypothetical protein
MTIINRDLTDYLNNIIPVLKDSTHDYFKKDFLNGFSWNGTREMKYLVEDSPKQVYINDGDFVLGQHESVIDKNFKNDTISGRGIFNFLHGVSHCWLKNEGYNDVFYDVNSNMVNHGLIEGFCEVSAMNIIKSSDIKTEFPESLVVANKIFNLYSTFCNLKEYTRNGSCLSFSSDNLSSHLNDVGVRSYNAIAVIKFSLFNDYKDMPELLKNNNMTGRDFVNAHPLLK